jgi:hypothetical protein
MADQSLIGASFKEALSRAGTNVPDLSQLYKGTATATQSYLKMINDTFTLYKEKNKLRKIGRDKQLGIFKNTLNEHYTELLAGAPMPQKVISAVDEEVRRLQDEFEAVNTFGKNDTQENERARMRINAELIKIINQAKNATTTFATLRNNQDDWAIGDINENIILAQNKMMHKDIDTDNDVAVRFINGKLTYSAQNYSTREATQEDIDAGYQGQVGDVIKYGDRVSYNLEQMAANFPAVNEGKQTEVYEVVNSYTQEAAVRGKNKDPENFDREFVEKEIAAKINNEDDFRTLALVRNGDLDETTFSQRLKLGGLLRIDITAMDALMQEKYGSLDTDGRNGITPDDLNGLSDEEQIAFEALYEEMVTVLSDPTHPQFDLERSKPLLVKYYADITENRYYTKYDSEVGGSNQIQLFGKTMPKPRLAHQVKEVEISRKIQNREPAITWGNDVYRWNPETNTYDLWKEKGAAIPYSQEDLALVDKWQFTQHEFIKYKLNSYVVGYLDDDYDFNQPSTQEEVQRR